MSDSRNEAGLSDGAGADPRGSAANPAPGAGGVADRARARADKVIGKVEGAVERTLGEPMARKVRLHADDAIDRAEGYYETARSRLDRELAEQPYKTLAFTALAGVVLGFILARR